LLLFHKAFLDSISLAIVNRHALSYVSVQVTVNAPLVRVKLVRVTVNGNPDSDSSLCERSLRDLTTSLEWMLLCKVFDSLRRAGADSHRVDDAWSEDEGLTVTPCCCCRHGLWYKTRQL